MIPVKEKLAYQDDGEEDLRSGVEIEGSDQMYKKVPSIHEKYKNRPKSLDNICLAQFAMLYDHLTGKEAAKRTFVNGSCDMSDMTIKSWKAKHETPLPTSPLAVFILLVEIFTLYFKPWFFKH